MIEEPHLPAAFRGAALDGASPAVLLDDRLRIRWANRAWSRFATENGGTPATWALGERYLDAISSPLRSWYARALGDALLGKTPWHHDYECPSPELARRFRLTAYPLRPAGGEGLLLVHTPIVERPHEGGGEPIARYRDAHGLVHVCMHCRRTRRLDESGWDWVPDSLHAPQVSHGICGPCCAYYFGAPDRC